jgi:lipoprotein-anchoring transpeptidase ErfK/SrfK
MRSGWSGTRIRCRRLGGKAVLAASLVAGSTLLASGCSGTPAAHHAAGGMATSIPATSIPAAPAAPAATYPTAPTAPTGMSLIATLRGTAVHYASAQGTADGMVPALWHGAKSELPVIGSRPGWVEVRIAQRPNGSTAWVHASAVTLSSTPYRIVINTKTMHLLLYKDAKEILSAPAGIGTASDPTPRGNYFVAFIESPPEPNPGYGAFIMVTSAHSPAIADWDGSGDAVIGIHGPLGDDPEIGTTGARISHGCIRLHEAELLKLRDVPPGSPIQILS